jgi:hypothetical protein
LIEDQLSKTTVITELARRGCPFIAASKDRARGIIRVREELAFERKGGELAKKPKLYFFKDLKRTRWEITHYQWDDWKRTSDRNAKQVPRDKDDHMMENLYRLLLCDPRWYDRSEAEADSGDDNTWRWAS